MIFIIGTKSCAFCRKGLYLSVRVRFLKEKREIFMNDNNDILDRLELLEQRYLVTRERLSKLERVQYQIRDQIGFIQFLSKDLSSQKPIEERLTEIYSALGEILTQIDGIQNTTLPSASQFVAAQVPQPAIPAQSGRMHQTHAPGVSPQPATINPMHQTHSPGVSQQVPSVAAMHKVSSANPMHQTHAPRATHQLPSAASLHQTNAPGVTSKM